MPILPNWRTKRTPSRWSDGPAAAWVIAQRTGKTPTRWQQYVLDVGLERIDGPGSPWAYHTVDVIVGRRGGKTVTLMGVPLFRALCAPTILDNGMVRPFVGAHTAQNLVKARQRFMKDLVEPYRATLTPAQWQIAHNLRSAISETALTIHPHRFDHPMAATINVFAPTTSSVRGDGIMHLGFDEAMSFTNQRGEELMAAARPTLAEMRGYGQMWRTSNITRMNGPTSWLWAIKERGREAVESDSRSGVAYFEFSIPDDIDASDETVWPQYHPAINDGLLRIDELRADFQPDGLGLDNAAAEYLGRWPGAVVVRRWSALTEAAFMKAGADTSPMPEGPAMLGVDIDPFGRSSTLAAAMPGAPDVVEVIDHRPGDAWVFDAVVKRAASVTGIAIDDYGPGHDLLARLGELPNIAHKLVPIRSADFIAACYTLEAGIREGSVRWVPSDFHRRLIEAASAAERTAGRSWQWERRVGVSQSPLVAVTLARWAVTHRPVIADSQIF